MSQCEPHIKEIGGKTFTVYKLPPKISQRLMLDVLKMLAPAISDVTNEIGAAESLTSLLDDSIGKIGGSASSLLLSLDIDKLEHLQAELAKVTHVTEGGGKHAELHKTFDVVFLGDLPLMYKWLWFAIVTQWGNFGGLVGKLQDLQARVEAKLANPSPSPSTSKGRG